MLSANKVISLDVLDVTSADIREIVRRRRDAKRIHADFEETQQLVGAVLAARDRDDAIVIGAVLAAVLLHDAQKFLLALVPVHLRPETIIETGIAHAVLVKREVWLGLGVEAGLAVAHLDLPLQHLRQ